MSDRPPDDRAPLLEDRVNDIASLMDTVGSDRAAIMGLSETGKVAHVFAATHPERTRAVIAYGSFAGGGDDRPTYPWAPDPGQAEWLEDLERNWGRGVLFLDEFAGSRRDDPHDREWFAKLERLSASPGAAVAVARMSMQTDVRDVLPLIRVPTLVLHKRDDLAVPVEEGKYIADHIPAATFVELPGTDHWPWIGHEEAVEEIQEFLTGMRHSAEPDRAIVTVMFVDIVDSTRRAAELGDRRWADLLESFYAVAVRALDSFRGQEIDRAGDGFFATFDGPAQAIRCASTLVARVGTLGLRIRIGIHTGECERLNGNLRGLGVVIGARVGALAAPGEILVSRTVRDLVVGSEVRFRPRDTHELKGVPGRWELYAVEEGDRNESTLES